MVTVLQVILSSHTNHIVTLNCFSLKTLVVRTVTKMKQEKTDCKEKSRRTPLDRLCCMTGLVLSIACSIAIIHVEFRIQDQQRLISQTTTIYDQMETEILRKLQQNYKRWGDPRGKTWQKNTGRFNGSCLLQVVSTDLSVDIAVDIAVDTRSI